MDGNLGKLVPETTRLTRLAVTGVIVVAIAGLAPGLSEREVPYRMLVDVDFAAWQGQELKLHGFVQAGTITPDGFAMVQQGKKVCVVFAVPSRTIRDREELIVRGRIIALRDDACPAMFVATEVYPKCAVRYASVPERADIQF